MRRNNMPRGGRGNKPTPNISPWMTDHLQVQDLDLKLELLKCKRKILQHQQQILVGNQQFHNPIQEQFVYGLHTQSYSSDQNVSRYYNDPPVHQSHNFGGGLLGKRPGNDSEWQPHSAPKRFSGPQGGAKNKFGAGPSPKPAPRFDALWPQPLMRQSGSNYLGQVAHKNKPNQRSQSWNKPQPPMGQKSGPRRPPPNKPLRKDFKPNKVAKGKEAPSSSVVNKLISYPILQRRGKMANKANLLHNQNDSNIESFTLRPDVVPSNLLVSRLEVALGHIVKDVKTAFGVNDLYKASFVSPYLLRKIKHLIRQRLSSVMMNKHVGKVGLIIEQYRAVFPAETDLQIAQDAQHLQQNAENKKFALRLVNADTPEEYLKMNMNKYLESILEEMFGKIQNIYENESLENVNEAFKNVLENIDDSIAEDITKKVDEDETKTKDAEIKEVETEDPNKSIINNTDEVPIKTEEYATETKDKRN